ncbi:MAG: ABC transporter permease [Saprospiraceae bacterium]|nr:ABC transporter permease [Saprospiraceae bacterium]
MQLKFILRSMARNKVYAAINILGLGLGIAAALLIFQVVRYELGYNKNFSRYDRIVRVVTQSQSSEGESWNPCVPIPAMFAIPDAVPELTQVARMREFWPSISVPGAEDGTPPKKFLRKDPSVAFFTEPSFFEIFDLEWLAGDSKTALRDEGSVVIIRSEAERFFGSWQAAMNETLVLDNVARVTVRGVVEDLPPDCDLPINMLASWPTYIAQQALYYYDDNWGSCNSSNQMFGLLADASQLEAAERSLAEVGQKQYAEMNGGGQTKKTHRLQPMSDLHFSDKLNNSAFRTITKGRLKVLSFIALLILGMACFNFINLSTAMASQRAKEIGVRKTLGVGRGQLLRQFLGETAVVSVLSVAVGVAVAWLCLPLLKHISDVPVEAPFLSLPQTWAFLVFVTMAVTLLAGFYPAVVLAGFEPAGALKNSVGGGRGGHRAWVRQSLVVLQFSIAIAFIVGTIITLSQLHFIRTKDLGFDQNLIYTFYYNNDSLSVAKLNTLKNRLLQAPEVEVVSYNTDPPSSGNSWMSNFAFPSNAEDADFALQIKYADTDYPKTFGLRMAAGKWYDPSDTMKQAVVNEAFLRKMGVEKPEDAIGEDLKLGGRAGIIITGVVQDFHVFSVHQPIAPLMISTQRDYYYNAAVKVNPGDMAAAARAIESAFDEVYPEQVFEGHWYDETIARFYEDENRFANACKGFGVLAIFIACIGLFGLSSHAAARRAKEIGIRKVLGAGTAGITALLARDFIKLVLVAFVLAAPAGWYFMNRWLQDFAYRIDIQWWVFVVAGAVALVGATLVVALQTVRAALADPVESLRSE